MLTIYYNDILEPDVTECSIDEVDYLLLEDEMSVSIAFGKKVKCVGFMFEKDEENMRDDV